MFTSKAMELHDYSQKVLWAGAQIAARRSLRARTPMIAGRYNYGRSSSVHQAAAGAVKAAGQRRLKR
jgi:hypothetical protein